jgi:hypothetical protein
VVCDNQEVVRVAGVLVVVQDSSKVHRKKAKGVCIALTQQAATSHNGVHAL